MASLASPPPSPLFARRSPHGSPPAAHHHMPLGVSNVANLLVKMRRASGRAKAKAKAHHIDSASGDGPRTHPGLPADGRRVPLVPEDVTFVCRDGVDAAKLLRGVRAVLFQRALDVGANVLVDER